MGATHCSECPPEKRMSRLALQMCCSRCSSFLCLTHMKKHLREHRHDFGEYCSPYIINSATIRIPCFHMLTIKLCRLKRVTSTVRAAQISCIIEYWR